MVEPTKKRAFVFVDGQNLFCSAKEAFGYTYPNYDVKLLAEKICLNQGCSLDKVNFYTGVPDLQDNIFWHNFWANKLIVMQRKGIAVFKRSLRYHNETIKLPDGKVFTKLVGHEKGIDVRIALDVVRFALQKVYDIAFIISQDQDLSEVVDEIREIAKEQKRWIKVASAFLISPTFKNKRGIDKTDWLKIDKRTYDSCLDPHDYRL